MINNEIIEKIKGIDEEYVISGSNATMLYIGRDIRECKDIDLHLSKRVFGEKVDKAIEHGKEKRKPYYGAQTIDCTCRPHGNYEWCKSNRLYKQLKM